MLKINDVNILNETSIVDKNSIIAKYEYELIKTKYKKEK